MRAVLDPNVVIVALLSPSGWPAKVLRSWLDGAYELIVSPLMLEELERALACPKPRERVSSAEGRDLLTLLRDVGDMRDDPPEGPSVRCSDPDDDYLLALAAASQAIIVSGDRHLLDLSDDVPVFSPAAFLAVIERDDR